MSKPNPPWLAPSQIAWEALRELEHSINHGFEEVIFRLEGERWCSVFLSDPFLPGAKSYDMKTMDSLVQSNILKLASNDTDTFLILTEHGRKAASSPPPNLERGIDVPMNNSPVSWELLPPRAQNVLEHLATGIVFEDCCFRRLDEKRWSSVASSDPFKKSTTSYAQSSIKALVEFGILKAETYNFHSFLVLTKRGYATINNPPSDEERGIPEDYFTG